jgi:hypothetical protein
MGATSVTGVSGFGAADGNKGPGNGRQQFVPLRGPHVVCAGTVEVLEGLEQEIRAQHLDEESESTTLTLPTPLALTITGAVDTYAVTAQLQKYPGTVTVTKIFDAADISATELVAIEFDVDLTVQQLVGSTVKVDWAVIKTGYA